jgi:hypothetical protein
MFIEDKKFSSSQEISVLVLRITKPPIRLASGALSPGTKEKRHESGYSHSNSTEILN